MENSLSQKANLKIDWATHEAAKYACTNWHYSKSVPINKKYPKTTRPGTVLKADENGVEVACGKDTLLLTELQAAGKKRLPAGEFIRGVHFTENAVLG